MEITPTKLADSGIETMTRRILNVIAEQGKRYETCDTEEKKDHWFSKTESLIAFHRGSEEISLKAQALLLLLVQEVWTERPPEFTKQYNNDFWSYAEEKTGKARSTLENHLRAIRTFFVDKIGPTSPTIKIPARASNGVAKTDASGAPVFEVVPWNPANIPLAKLVAATARAKADSLTPSQWGMLADDKCSWEQFQISLSGGGGGGGNGIGYVLAGDFLFAKEGNQEAYLGNLSLPHDDPDVLIPDSASLRERALKRLALLLNIKTDETAMREALHRNGLKIYNPLDETGD